MEIIGLILTCLIVGAVIIGIGSLLFYLFIIAVSKIADFLDIGCGCFGLICVGFIALVIIGFISSIV